MDSPPPIPDYLTLTEVCQIVFGNALRHDRARLAYAVECYGIKPARKVGTVRLWHRDDVPRLRAAVSRITARVREVRGE